MSSLIKGILGLCVLVSFNALFYFAPTEIFIKLGVFFAGLNAIREVFFGE